MSETLTIDDNAVLTREPPQRRQEPPPVEVAVEDSAPQDDVEAKLVNAQKAVQAKEQEVAAANAATRRAQTEAAKARDEAARANHGRAQDRVAAVASALEGAKADQAMARSAKRAARDAGDIDAELAADEMFSSATYRLNQAAGELNYLKQAGGTTEQRAPEQAAGPTEATQRWLDEHPRFFTDSAYHDAATRAHNAAVHMLGQDKAGSPEYIAYIDRVLGNAYGADHGKGQARRENEGQDTMSGARTNATSTAGATSRGGGGSGAGAGRTVQTPLGTVRVLARADGRRSYMIPPPGSAERQDWEEYAAINKMTLEAYVDDQVRIHDEMAAGGNAGWIKGDGTVHR